MLKVSEDSTTPKMFFRSLEICVQKLPGSDPSPPSVGSHLLLFLRTVHPLADFMFDNKIPFVIGGLIDYRTFFFPCMLKVKSMDNLELVILNGGCM